MSEENVEIVRRQIERFQAGMERGDPGAVFDAETVAADAEWIVREGMDGRTVWVGREEFVQFIRTWTEEFEDWSIRAEQLIDLRESGSERFGPELPGLPMLCHRGGRRLVSFPR